MTSSIDSKRDQIRRILQLPPPPMHNSPKSGSESVDPAARDLEDAISGYMRRAAENFDLTKNVEVCVNNLVIKIKY